MLCPGTNRYSVTSFNYRYTANISSLPSQMLRRITRLLVPYEFTQFAHYSAGVFVQNEAVCKINILCSHDKISIKNLSLRKVTSVEINSWNFNEPIIPLGVRMLLL